MSDRHNIYQLIPRSVRICDSSARQICKSPQRRKFYLFSFFPDPNPAITAAIGALFVTRVSACFAYALLCGFSHCLFRHSSKHRPYRNYFRFRLLLGLLFRLFLLSRTGARELSTLRSSPQTGLLEPGSLSTFERSSVPTSPPLLRALSG